MSASIVVRPWSFKSFVNGKPVLIKAEQVKQNPTSFDMIEVGANISTDLKLVKNLESANAQLEKKVLSADEYSALLQNVNECGEMVAQLTQLRALLISKGYGITGQIACAYHDGWVNARLYRVVKLSAEESNAAQLAAL